MACSTAFQSMCAGAGFGGVAPARKRMEDSISTALRMGPPLALVRGDMHDSCDGRARMSRVIGRLRRLRIARSLPSPKAVDFVREIYRIDRFLPEHIETRGGDARLLAGAAENGQRESRNAARFIRSRAELRQKRAAVGIGECDVA